MAMILTDRTIRSSLAITNRKYKPEWYLSHVWWLNSFHVSWGRSNPNATLWCYPTLAKPFILTTASEGPEVKFDYKTDPLWFSVPLLGDGTRLVLEIPKGSAQCFITLDVEVELKEHREQRTLDAQAV